MKAFLIACSLVVASGLATAADPAPLTDAVALHQISQRVTKAYCQVGLNVEPADARRQLTDGMAEADAALARLARAGDPALAPYVGKVAEAWARLRPQVAGIVSRTAARQLADDADDMQAAAARLAAAAQDRARDPGTRQRVAAARLAMLSQRIAKTYMLLQWDVSTTAGRDDIDAALREFQGGLDFLRAQEANTPALREALDDLALQWEWFRTALQTDGALSFRLIVAESSEAILGEIQKVAAQLAAPPGH